MKPMQTLATSEAVKVFFESEDIFDTYIPRREKDRIDAEQVRNLNADVPTRAVRVKKCRSFQDKVKTIRDKAAACNDARYYLNSVFFDLDENKVVGSDGHRMVIWSPEQGIPESYKGKQLPGNKGVIVGHDENAINATYPDYQRVLDSTKKEAIQYTCVYVSNVLSKLNSIKRAAKFLQSTPGVLLKLGNTTVYFNISYLYEAFEVFARFGKIEIDLHMGGSETALYLSADNIEVVVMPMIKGAKVFAPIELPESKARGFRLTV